MHRIALPVFTLLIAFLVPARAQAPTLPNALGTYEGRLRATRPGGLTRPFDVHLEITTQRADGTLGGVLFNSRGFASSDAIGTISADRRLFVSSHDDLHLKTFQASVRFDKHFKRLKGLWEELPDREGSSPPAHGIINLRRL